MMTRKITRTGWESLGRVIRAQRLARDLTLDAVIQEIKTKNPDSTIGSNTLSSLERGTSEPKISTLMDLSLIELVKDSEGRPLRVYDMIRIAELNSDEELPKRRVAEPVMQYAAV